MYYTVNRKHTKTQTWQYSWECVQVSIPTIGNKKSFESHSEKRMRAKDVTLSVVLNNRVYETVTKYNHSQNISDKL